MIKKNILIISLIFILTNCGFTPIYLNNNEIWSDSVYLGTQTNNYATFYLPKY